MSKDTGGSAFPWNQPPFQPSPGMTLRDYFAAKATEEDIRANMVFGEGYNDPQDRAAARFRHADHMLSERAK